MPSRMPYVILHMYLNLCAQFMHDTQGCIRQKSLSVMHWEHDNEILTMVITVACLMLSAMMQMMI